MYKIRKEYRHSERKLCHVTQKELHIAIPHYIIRVIYQVSLIYLLKRHKKRRKRDIKRN